MPPAAPGPLAPGPPTKSGGDSLRQPGSRSSGPASICRSSAESRTVLVIGPGWEIALKAGLPTPPNLGTLPWVGLIPKMPLKLHGMRMDPPPSEPVATVHSPDATAAPAPPLEPPEVRPGSQGLRHSSPRRLSVVPENPNSGVLVLPRITAPELLILSTTMESCSGTWSLKAALPMVDLMPRVTSRSLIEIEMSSRYPSDFPRDSLSSESLADCRASSSVTVR